MARYLHAGKPEREASSSHLPPLKLEHPHDHAAGLRCHLADLPLVSGRHSVTLLLL